MKKKDFDVYICDGDVEHRILVERNHSWDDTAMEAIVCPVCKEVAGYEGFVSIEMPLSYLSHQCEKSSPENAGIKPSDSVPSVTAELLPCQQLESESVKAGKHRDNSTYEAKEMGVKKE